MEPIAYGLIAFTGVNFSIALVSFFRNTEKTKTQKDIITLEKEIKKLRSQSMANDDIVKRLSGAGWDEHVVELAMHEAKKPNNNLEKLQEYVDSRIRKGDSKELLKETLIEAGWSEDVIDIVLKIG